MREKFEAPASWLEEMKKAVGYEEESTITALPNQGQVEQEIFPLTRNKLIEILRNTSPEANRRLRDSMERVRSIFFPRWNRNNSCLCYALPDTVFDVLHQGTQENIARMAYFQYLPWNVKLIWGREKVMAPVFPDEEIDSVMIHEICHALTFRVRVKDGHGPLWQDRMLKCLNKAFRLKMNDEFLFYIAQHCAFFDLEVAKYFNLEYLYEN